MHSMGTIKGVVCLLAVFGLISLGFSGESRDLYYDDPEDTNMPVFVADYYDGQIHKVDSVTGDYEVIFDIAVDGEVGEIFYPEDMVIGPDNLLYIADSVGQRIVRMDQEGSNVETIAYWSDPDPMWPEGMSFGPSDDLYFNTRGNIAPATWPYHTGVWKIPGIAEVPYGGDEGEYPDPVQVLTPAQSGIGIGFGEGTAWTPSGELLIVDRTHGRVMMWSPPATSAVSIIENLGDDAIGIAVNGAGEIFVGRTHADQILKYPPGGGVGRIWASFTDEGPGFMEFDASDNLWLSTFIPASGGDPEGGNVYRIGPDMYRDLITDDGLPGGGGLAIPSTSESDTQEFTPEDNSRFYDFGDHTLIITTDVQGSCDVTVIATETAPEEVAGRMATYFPGAECVRYGGRGGDCIVYSIDPYPLPSCFVGDYIELVTKYYAEAESNPAFLHDPSDVPGDDFAEDILVSYYPDGLPGDDPAKRGRTDTFQEFVSADLGFGEAGPGYFLGFEPPLLPDGSAIFKSGRTIPVKFSAMDELGVPILDAVAKLAVARIEPDFQIMPVQPAGGSNVGTLFRITDEGTYSYNLKTTGYAPGLYSLTVSSDSFPPQTVRFTIR